MGLKRKNWLLTTIIYFVIFAAYNLFVFLVFNDYNDIFWVSYGFMLVAYLIHIGCVFFIFKNTSINAVFFGIPLLSLSIYFVCAELFSSLVFMIFKSMANMKTAILIQALLLMLFLVIAIIAIMTRDTVQNVDDKIKQGTTFIKGLHVDIEMMMQRSQNLEVTSELKKLSEIVRYSDPMSRPEVSMQEQMIMQGMTELRMALDAVDIQRSKEICSRLSLIFVERNKKLMLLK